MSQNVAKNIALNGRADKAVYGVAHRRLSMSQNVAKNIALNGRANQAVYGVAHRRLSMSQNVAKNIAFNVFALIRNLLGEKSSNQRGNLS